MLNTVLDAENPKINRVALTSREVLDRKDIYVKKKIKMQ